MACKQGIRQDIDASRAFYQRLKIYDPVQELWKSLVKRSSDDPSLQSLSKAERTYFVVSLLEGEIYNGGFDQFFYNSSGDYCAEVVQALQELGAHRSLKLVREAVKTAFGEMDPPSDRMERWERMRYSPEGLREPSLEAERSARLVELDKQFYKDEDGLFDLLTAYAEAHNLTKPFEQDA
jgi:hypothetical protein